MTYEELEVLINKFNIAEYDEEKIDDLYDKYLADEGILLNIFCQLLGVLTEYEREEVVDKKMVAHISFLISRYSFIDLTQAKSEEISVYYATKANDNYPCDKYDKWIAFVKKGN